MEQVTIALKSVLVYRNLPTYRKIYSESTKQALDSNEIVFLVTTYDSFERVIDSLTQAGISVNNETKEDNLIILDSVKAYQIGIHGAANFATTLAKRAERDGKASVFGLTEMGSFFIAERTASLLEYEQVCQKSGTLISNPSVHITKMTFQVYLNSSKKTSFQPIIV
jgi:hypothetical protein